LVVGVDVDGRDRFGDLVDIAHERSDLTTPLPSLDRVMAEPVVTTGGIPDDAMRARGWTKQRLRDMQALNYGVLQRFGALPGADRDHTIEFLPGFITEASAWGKRWGVEPTTIDERRVREARYQQQLAERMHATQPPKHRSTELVVDVVEALETGAPFVGPMNIPNAGQCPDIADGPVVESICIADASGIRGRDRVSLPPVLASLLRRIVASQELTLDAALTGSRDTLLHALFTDPVSRSLDHDALVALRDAIVNESTTRPAAT
jgi:alpha-galactosidase